jgi:hypothetical protein
MTLSRVLGGGLDATSTQLSPPNKQKKAQSRAIVANKKTAKSSLPR